MIRSDTSLTQPCHPRLGLSLDAAKPTVTSLSLRVVADSRRSARVEIDAISEVQDPLREGIVMLAAFSKDHGHTTPLFRARFSRRLKTSSVIRSDPSLTQSCHSLSGPWHTCVMFIDVRARMVRS